MTDYRVELHPPSVRNAVDFLEHTAMGQQVASELVASFSSVGDMLDHTHNTRGGSVTELLTGDTVDFAHIHKPRLAKLARQVASALGLNAS